MTLQLFTWQVIFCNQSKRWSACQGWLWAHTSNPKTILKVRKNDPNHYYTAKYGTNRGQKCDPPLSRECSGGRIGRPAPAPSADRLPEKETVTDYSQGVPLKTVQQVLHYWQTEYDWRKVKRG